MHPLIGWALVDNAPEASDEYETGLVALLVWSEDSGGSEPDASPHFVLHARSGFVGFMYPGCTIDWQKLADFHRKAAYDEEANEWKE